MRRTVRGRVANNMSVAAYLQDPVTQLIEAAFIRNRHEASLPVQKPESSGCETLWRLQELATTLSGRPSQAGSGAAALA
jgi:hypothetical protein